MRLPLLIACMIAVAAPTFSAQSAYAQNRRQSDADKQEEDAAKKRKRDEEWGDRRAPLPQLRNAGPCPFVKVLYDAGRYVEFKDNREASSAVAYSGEIQGISAGCRYKDAEPIQVSVEMLFELGKGPQATGDRKSYRYWVAVTKRNDAILTKEFFDLPVEFENGADRVYVTEKLESITIPRASLTTSGANFEILVGFDVTPEQAAFNRDGKRFRVNVGGTVAAAGDTSQQR